VSSVSGLDAWIKIYDGPEGVPLDFCERAIDFFETSSARHKLDHPWQRCHQIGNLHTTPLHEDLRGAISGIFARYKRDVACGTLNYVGRLEAPTLTRYDVADAAGVHHFHSHADCWSMATASRQVSVILYLNDVLVGGETVFDGGLSVTPRAGRALVFPSSFCFQHCGKPPVSNPKYLIVAWLHFDGTGHVYTTMPL
jgi:hypothetical protein